MPNRILREGILTSRAVNAVSEEAELLYRRLVSIVDDYGREVDDLDLIRARCFPLQLERWPVERIERAMQELSTCIADATQRAELVSRYKVGGRKYFQINNFRQQTRSKPKFPEPPAKHMRSICAASAHLDGDGGGDDLSETKTDSDALAETPRAHEPPAPSPQHLALSREPAPGFHVDQALDRFLERCKAIAPERIPAQIHTAWVDYGPKTAAEEAAVHACLASFEQSHDWRKPDRAIPRFDRWLEAQHQTNFEARPQPYEPAKTASRDERLADDLERELA